MNDAPKDQLIIQRFVNALKIEISETKKRSSSRSIVLNNGKIVDKGSGIYIYEFPFKEAAPLREDSRVKITISGDSIEGSIVSFSKKKLRISLEQEYGASIPEASLELDNSYLLVKLMEVLQSKDDNDGLIKKVLRISETSSKDTTQNIFNETLNEEQNKALQLSSLYEVTYLWGPPGTGKTYTLGEIASNYYENGQKVLMLSNTNLAIDILLRSLCDSIQEKNIDELEKSLILRYGTKIQDMELKESYEGLVDIDLIIDRKSSELKKEIRQFHDSLAPLEKRKSVYDEIKEEFTNCNNYKKNRADLELKKDSYEENILALKKRITFVLNKEDTLKKELNVSKDTSFIGRLISGKRSVDDICQALDYTRGDHKSLMQEKDNLGSIAEIETRINELCQLELTSEDKIHSITSNLTSTEESKLYSVGEILNILEVEIIIEDISSEINKFKNEINEREAKIENFKTQLISDCRILATTATQTYLNPKMFHQFDVVIIDESSMLPLPVVAYIASMAKNNIIVSGDFKQLPPIITADEKKFPEVKQWVGSDIFQKSGIEDIINAGKTVKNLVKLTKQYRMEDSICQLINERFYGGDLVTMPEAGRSEKKYPEILEDSNIVLIDSSKYHPFNALKGNTYSRYNLLHAKAIRNLIFHLNEENFIETSSDLGVITPYNAQAEIIGNIIEDYGITNIECGTIHRFQGKEKEVTIFDITDSWGIPYVSKLLSDYKLMNVAISRARGCLIIIANKDYLEKKMEPSSLVRGILVDIQKLGKEIPIEKIIKLGPDSHPQIYDAPLDVETSNRNILTEMEYFNYLEQDILNARKFIVILSAFCTMSRVKKLLNLFKKKIKEGVIIRCITSAPKKQGSIKPSEIVSALNILKEIGVRVDVRADTHDKIVWIDENTIYTGSLNTLSSSISKEETMLRDDSMEFSRSIAQHHLHNRTSVGNLEKSSTFDILMKKYNPDCPNCGGITSYTTRQEARSRKSLFKCIECDWSQPEWEFNKSTGQNNTKRQTKITENPKVENKTCLKCGKPLNLKNGRRGHFYSCSGWKPGGDGCNYTEDYIGSS